MIRILGTIFAGLLGLAFGSFLNVCVSRWPLGESVVQPRSHCRSCDHTLIWWENIPLLGWLVLGGRCRACHTQISWRYPLLELAIATLWACSAWKSLPVDLDNQLPAAVIVPVIASHLAQMILFWFLVALAVLDAENFWLPNFLTLPGILLGLVVSTATEQFRYHSGAAPQPLRVLLSHLLAVVVAAGLILLIRWLYTLVRHREGIGLGDAKLMALLAAWLGLPGAIFAFCIGAILGAMAALALLAIPALRRHPEPWSATKLPLGTFLCIGGIFSSLWGQRIIDAYLQWSGF